MSSYTYTAKRSPGEYVSGEIEAESADIIRARLKEDGLFPLSVVESEGGIQDGWSFPRWRRSASSQDLAMFARQLGNMLSAGLPVLRSLETLSEQTENRWIRRAVRQLTADLRKGSSLAAALGRQPHVFSSAFSASVHAGETGGSLDTVLGTLADHYETEADLWSGVKAAMIYPCFLALAGAGTVFVLLSFVIPNFITLFQELGADLPLPTIVLIEVSGFMSRFWWAIPITLAVAGVLLTRYGKTSVGRLTTDRLRLRIPLVGRLIHHTEAARYCRTFGMLLASGVPAVDAMTIAADALRNRAIAAQAELARDSVRQGERAADSLAKVRYFPMMLTNLVAIGELVP